jgi:hydroxymethylglutaryl-CoA reductase
MSWRDTKMALEYKTSKGFEFEKSIRPEDLSENLKEKYHSLQEHYDEVHIEKVYAFGKQLLMNFIVIRIMC